MESVQPKMKHVLKTSTHRLRELGEKLLESIQLYNSTQIIGMNKFKRAVQKEYDIVRNIEKDVCNGSNLPHLLAVWDQFKREKNVTHIMKPIRYLCTNKTGKEIINHCEVDLVCDNGQKWIKIRTRNPYAMQLNCLNTYKTDKNVIHHAKTLVEASKQHQVLFRPPHIECIFLNGVTSDVVRQLELIGVHIKGQIIPVDDDLFETVYSDDDKQNHEEKKQTGVDKTRINLDVCTLCTMISNISNGFISDKYYNKPNLLKQANNEKNKPVLLMIHSFIENKQLIVCQTAFDCFQKIIDPIAGPEEKKRAKSLISKLQIVPNQISSRTQKLTGKLKRSKLNQCVFGTGDSLNIITVTANESFVRSAMHQNVCFNVLTHPPRSLSEKFEQIEKDLNKG